MYEQDLVPCVLISFEYEHILMWRGKDWKSSLPPIEGDHNEAAELIADDSTSISSSISNFGSQASAESFSEKSSDEELITEDVHIKEDFSHMDALADSQVVTSETPETCMGIEKSADEELNPEIPFSSISVTNSAGSEEIKDLSHPSSECLAETDKNMANQEMVTDIVRCNNAVMPQKKCLNGVMLLLQQAVETGSAVILGNESLDANIVYERSFTLAKSAPPGPVFKRRIRKVAVQKSEIEKPENDEKQNAEFEAITISEERSNGRNSRSRKREDFKEVFTEVVPRGSLRVDELAKLLA